VQLEVAALGNRHCPRDHLGRIGEERAHLAGAFHKKLVAGDAERCNFKLHAVENPFPEFAVPEGHTIDSYFEEVSRAGLRKRLETSIRQLELRGVLRKKPEEYQARLEFEIGIIKQMKYSGYFLIVWDFISMRGTMDTGGSGARFGDGVAVAYAMEITNVDPLQNRCSLSGF